MQVVYWLLLLSFMNSYGMDSATNQSALPLIKRSLHIFAQQIDLDHKELTDHINNISLHLEICWDIDYFTSTIKDMLPTLKEHIAVMKKNKNFTAKDKQKVNEIYHQYNITQQHLFTKLESTLIQQDYNILQLITYLKNKRYSDVCNYIRNNDELLKCALPLREELVKALLPFYANKKLTFPLLHHAVQKSSLETIKFLMLKRKLNPNEGYGCRNETPLHKLAKRKKQEDSVLIAQELIQKAADVNIKNNQGLTPLHCATGHHNVPLVKFFLEQEIIIINETNSVYAIALKKGYTDLLQLFLEHNIPIDEKTKSTVYTKIQPYLLLYKELEKKRDAFTKDMSI